MLIIIAKTNTITMIVMTIITISTNQHRKTHHSQAAPASVTPSSPSRRLQAYFSIWGFVILGIVLSSFSGAWRFYGLGSQFFLLACSALFTTPRSLHASGRNGLYYGKGKSHTPERLDMHSQAKSQTPRKVLLWQALSSPPLQAPWSSRRGALNPNPDIALKLFP